MFLCARGRGTAQGGRGGRGGVEGGAAVGCTDIEGRATCLGIRARL